jgi:lipopolysaccharide/colanic/teichoic acid biosynthesis glycosyltransferase
MVFWPIFLAVAALIRLTSRGPILFTQKRAGLRGAHFSMHKFRTLCVDADPTNNDVAHLNERDGPAFKIEDDPRATSLGRWLRASGLDELPQIWNILRGDMSLVGPRPLPIHEMDACRDWQRARLQVKPGLTCVWQVRRNEVSFDEWMAMDVDYVNSVGLLVDLKLLAVTPAVMLRRIICFGGKRD